MAESSWDKNSPELPSEPEIEDTSSPITPRGHTPCAQKESDMFSFLLFVYISEFVIKLEYQRTYSYLNTFKVNSNGCKIKGAFLWDDPDQDQ